MHISNERRNLYIFPDLSLLVEWPQCIYTAGDEKENHTE